MLPCTVRAVDSVNRCLNRFPFLQKRDDVVFCFHLKNDVVTAFVMKNAEEKNTREINPATEYMAHDKVWLTRDMNGQPEVELNKMPEYRQTFYVPRTLIPDWIDDPNYVDHRVSPNPHATA